MNISPLQIISRTVAVIKNLRSTIILIALGHSLVVFAATPVGLRMDGRSDFSTAKPQTEWGPAQHVVWSPPLPQWSNAGPVLVGDRIFVCAEPSTLICMDVSGKILWQHSSDYPDLPALTAAEAENDRATITAEKLPEQNRAQPTWRSPAVRSTLSVRLLDVCPHLPLQGQQAVLYRRVKALPEDLNRQSLKGIHPPRNHYAVWRTMPGGGISKSGMPLSTSDLR